MPHGNTRTGEPLSLLPPCPGPKLHAFHDRNAPIQWLERLDEDREDQPETQGSVFKVIIASRVYALKVFKFFDPMETEFYWGTLLDDDCSADTAAYYMDPFYAECRAYGRIKEAQDQGRLSRRAVAACHGYLFLTDDDKEVLQARGVDLGEEEEEEESEEGSVRSVAGPVRAIVKDLESGDTGVTSNTLGRILRVIRALNKLEIYNRDIRADNFCGGKLVDFGSSWTEPHIILDAVADFEARDTRLEDLVMFDEMVAQEQIVTTLRGTRNLEYCRKLRRRRTR